MLALSEPSAIGLVIAHGIYFSILSFTLYDFATLNIQQLSLTQMFCQKCIESVLKLT